MAKVRGRRLLLNPPGFHSTGAIVAEISNTSKRKPGCDEEGKLLSKDSTWGAQPEYIQFTISDCARSINIDFGWDTAADRRAAIYKVDRMLEAISAFREGLVAEQALYVERVKIARSVGGS